MIVSDYDFSSNLPYPLPLESNAYPYICCIFATSPFMFAESSFLIKRQIVELSDLNLKIISDNSRWYS